MKEIIEVANVGKKRHSLQRELSTVLQSVVENIAYEKAGRGVLYDYVSLYNEINRIKNEIDSTSNSLSNKAASFVKGWFVQWDGDTAYKNGQKIVYNDTLYEVIRDLDTPVSNWTPDITYDYYTPIPNAYETGEFNKPIKAAAGMVYEGGRYYTESDKTYLCTYDGKIKLHYLPSALIGHYFVEV